MSPTLCGFWALNLSAFFADWFFRRVPNWLVLAGAAVQVFLLILSDAGYHVGGQLSPTQAVVGAVVAFAFLLPFYAFRAMGAGDVKFFAVLGLWLGLPDVLIVWALASVLAGLHAVVQVVSRGAMNVHAPGWQFFDWAPAGTKRREMYDWFHARQGGRRGIPYAAYLAVAAVTVPPAMSMI